MNSYSKSSGCSIPNKSRVIVIEGCLMWLDQYGFVEVRGGQLVRDIDIIRGVRIGSGK